jgi:hypothetical protein
MGTDYIGSYKSNYHTITTMTVPLPLKVQYIQKISISNISKISYGVRVIKLKLYLYVIYSTFVRKRITFLDWLLIYVYSQVGYKKILLIYINNQALCLANNGRQLLTPLTNAIFLKGR